MVLGCTILNMVCIRCQLNEPPLKTRHSEGWDPPFWTKDVGERFMICQQAQSLSKKVLVKLFNAKDDG